MMFPVLVVPRSLKGPPTNGTLNNPETSGHHVQRSTPSQITATCENFTVIVARGWPPFTHKQLFICAHRPRDGKQLNAQIILHALEEGYGLSSALARILVYGGIALLGQFGSFGLNDLARHNRIEHDASLVHDDTPHRDEYAPLAPNRMLIREFLEQAKDGQVMTVEDVARARVWRESQCPVLNTLHSEIARGEMAIALGLFGSPDSAKPTIPVDVLRVWLGEERLPSGWKPTHIQGLLETIRTSRQINEAMKKFASDGEDVAPDSHGEA